MTTSPTSMETPALGKVPEGHPLAFLSKNWTYVTNTIPDLVAQFQAIERLVGNPAFQLQWKVVVLNSARIQAAKQFAEALPSRVNRPPPEDELERLDTYDDKTSEEWKTTPILFVDLIKARYFIKRSIAASKKALETKSETQSDSVFLGVEAASSAVNLDPTLFVSAPVSNICGVQHGGNDTAFRASVLCKALLAPTTDIFLRDYSRVYLSKLHRNPLVNGKLFQECKSDSVAVRDSEGLHIGVQTGKLIGIAWALFCELVDGCQLVTLSTSALRQHLITETCHSINEPVPATGDTKNGKK